MKTELKLLMMITEIDMNINFNFHAINTYFFKRFDYFDKLMRSLKNNFKHRNVFAQVKTLKDESQNIRATEECVQKNIC